MPLNPGDSEQSADTAGAGDSAKYARYLISIYTLDVIELKSLYETSPPPLNALHTFEAAARLGKMIAAAEELSVTPGAVSRQVRQLELSLGVDLFEGPKNKPQLTVAGRELLPELTAALDQIEAAVSRVRDTATGTLDVSCFSTFTVKWLIPRLFDFNTTYPGIKIRLSSPVHGSDPGRDRYDVMITAEQGIVGEQKNTVRLFPERLGVVLSPTLSARIQLADVGSIFSHPLLLTKTRPDAWANWGMRLDTRPPRRPGWNTSTITLRWRRRLPAWGFVSPHGTWWLTTFAWVAWWRRSGFARAATSISPSAARSRARSWICFALGWRVRLNRMACWGLPEGNATHLSVYRNFIFHSEICFSLACISVSAVTPT